ncbi:MAG: EamA family transporter [Phocaeicola sp.]
MWLFYAFLSATLLGCYDVFKKKSLKENAVIPVLFLNTLFSTLLFLPFIVLSATAPQLLEDTLFFVPSTDWGIHRFIVLKSFIVLSSWVLGYFSMKHLPLTIIGPINATRPVMVLMGALFIFGERLNVQQWIGVLLAMGSFYMLSRSGKREGIDFKQNKWIYFAVAASVLGAMSGLYDKHLMAPVSVGGLGFEPMVVQSYYNVYQLFMMLAVLVTIWWPNRKKDSPFRWDWCIICISLFLSAADFVYFYALSFDEAMISIVSMIRRGSVIVSFLFGALLFREKNLKRKAVDLLLVLLGMLFLYWGTLLKG